MSSVHYKPATELRFFPTTGGNPVCLRGPDSTVPGPPIVFKLPSADGAAGHVMTTNGAGQWSFAAATGGGGTLPANVAFLDVAQIWLANQQFNTPCLFGGVTNFAKEILITRSGTGGVPGIPAIDTHCAIWITDGDQPGQGSSQAWVAKDNTGVGQAIAKQVVEMENTTPGTLKSKLAWWLIMSTGGLQKLWEISSNGDIQSAYTRMGTGSPEGVVVANVGTIYIDKAGLPGSVLWVKESTLGAASAIGWVAK